MVIKRDDVLGKNSQPKRKPEPSPEAQKALKVLQSIDTGMTITRFQIEAGKKFSQDAEEGVTIDDVIRTAVYTLSTIDPEDSDADKAEMLGVALEDVVIAIDLLDRDAEDVARSTLEGL